MDLTAARRMIDALMAEHLYETAQGHDWTFRWDNAKNRAGVAQYARRQISMSRHLAALWDEAEVRDTILHEIAHVLAGHEAGHGPVWKAHARAVGARPTRTHSGQTMPARYVGTCQCAGKQFKRHRMTDRARNGHCPTCLFTIAWTDSTTGEVLGGSAPGMTRARYERQAAAQAARRPWQEFHDLFG